MYRQSIFRMFSIALLSLVGQGSFRPPMPCVYSHPQEADDPTIRVVKRDGEFVFQIGNVAHPESTVLKVWLRPANIDVDPPMMGAMQRVDGGLVFKPRFPLRPNTEFIVAVQQNASLKPFHLKVSTPATEQPTTTINAVFPSSSVLPENTLKFYICFSAPMRKGEIYDFIKLRQVDGAEIELPFLEIEQELWSRDSTRLTLLLDPGRIKRGLKPREEMGPIFVSGKSYELVVDGAWPDARGVELGKTFVKQFRVSDEDRTQPDPRRWKVVHPKVASDDPLVLEFSEPLDHPMLQRAIRVVDANGDSVAGKLNLSDHEKRWSFVPDGLWRRGEYSVLIDENLEDNAGNSIGRAFDIDVFNETESSTGQVFELKFQL